jgi:hypothetical protein
VTGVLLYQWQTRTAALTYRVQEALPFSDTNETTAIYQVSISNSGSSVAEDINCVVDVPGGLVASHRVKADAALTYEDSASGSSYRLKTASLNPGESVVVSLLARGDASIGSRPTVSLRAKGHIGREESLEQSKRTLSSDLKVALAAAYAGLFSIFITRRLLPKWVGRHSDDQREVLAYLCGMHGLLAEAEHLLQMPRRTSYWAQADRLGNRGVLKEHETQRGAYKNVLADLLVYTTPADLSKGIVHYNIAKITLAAGDRAAFKQHIELAEKFGGRLIRTRIQIDPQMRSDASPSVFA